MKHFQPYFKEQLNLLKAIRKKARKPWTNEAIAEEMGCATSTIACYANGFRKPTKENDLAEIVNFFVEQHIAIYEQSKVNNVRPSGSGYTLRKIHLYSIVYGGKVSDAYLMNGAITYSFFEAIYLPFQEELHQC